MALDARLRTTLLDYHAGRCDLDAAAARLLQVRRETGCLELRAAPNATAADHALVDRVTELVRQEFGG
jgi:hypothetical protein